MRPLLRKLWHMIVCFGITVVVMSAWVFVVRLWPLDPWVIEFAQMVGLGIVGVLAAIFTVVTVGEID